MSARTLVLTGALIFAGAGVLSLVVGRVASWQLAVYFAVVIVGLLVFLTIWPERP